MRKITKVLSGAVAAVGALTALAVTAPAAQAAGTYQGCPYGAVCVYPQNTDWNNGHPSQILWSYGVHKLSNQYGQHMVFNNQYGGAKAKLCKGWDGSNCVWYYDMYTANNYDLGPINTIVISPTW
ncbi:hypothetical protein AB0E69_04325 [Kribbella sp. NPDC026611]|uniref:hypothetical protein n=1 Tax=Kribbella sp. NPDC026611 TaxID=3154911 RepID=UPI0033F59133